MVASALFLRRLRPPEVGREFLELLVREVPELTPDKLDLHEPLRRPFAMSELDEVWADPFVLFSGAGFRGGIHFVAHDLWPSGFDCEFDARRVPVESVARFMRQAAVRFDMVFGLVHRKTAATDDVELLATIHKLREGIQDLYWLTILGAPYDRVIGHEQLLATPAHAVEELDGSHVLLQLTPSIEDVVEAPEELERARERARDHIGRMLFATDDEEAVVGIPFELLPTELEDPSIPELPQAGDADEIAAEMADAAGALMRVAQSEGWNLDGSVESVDLLDRMIDELWEATDAEGTGRVEPEFEQMAPLIGAYLGEVFARDLGGRWDVAADGSAAMRLPGDAWVYPLHKAYRRFQNGHDDDLPFYYATMRELLG